MRLSGVSFTLIYNGNWTYGLRPVALWIYFTLDTKKHFHAACYLWTSVHQQKSTSIKLLLTLNNSSYLGIWAGPIQPEASRCGNGWRSDCCDFVLPTPSLEWTRWPALCSRCGPHLQRPPCLLQIDSHSSPDRKQRRDQTVAHKDSKHPHSVMLLLLKNAENREYSH